MGNSPSRPIVQESYGQEVPPGLRFSRERTMILASLFASRKLMCFPTPHSYERFLNNKRKIDIPANLEDGGLGIPLFEFKYDFFNVPFSSAPKFEIYKYTVIEKGQDYLIPADAKVICVSGGKQLIKSLFCEIWDKTFKGLRTGYEFVFQSQDGPQQFIMLKHHMRENFESTIGDWHVNWCSGFDSTHMDLVVLDPDMPFLFDDKETAAKKKALEKTQKKGMDDLPLWARFRFVSPGILPKLTTKQATLTIGEIDLETNPTEFGLAAIPWYSQIIACMSLLLAYRVERRRKRNNSNNQLNSTIF
ncbi:LAMI_0G08878g1_1 [Lachancea mirantina]|uniref:LAMI_0G08878g1_1 n=1 Tax=Lachancea mirantina TaxID=1230905 RepID=A0A1G4KA22_9SACH|nr:LAMI_0G08878g1_1 [Lachancea mirantina]